MRIILLAAPGAGKGTQAEKLSEHFNIPTISTGAILRKNIKEKTELGIIADKYITDGKFVPDSIMIDVMADRLAEDDCKNGFILDGFPRTLTQADSMSNLNINIDSVISIYVPDDTIVKRLSDRMECEKCSTTYNKQFRPPVQENICDKCGGNLVVREDDRPETVRARLNTYHEQTEPLLNYYRDKGLLKVVQGQIEIEDTTREVLKALEA